MRNSHSGSFLRLDVQPVILLLQLAPQIESDVVGFASLSRLVAVVDVARRHIGGTRALDTPRLAALDIGYVLFAVHMGRYPSTLRGCPSTAFYEPLRSAQHLKLPRV